MSCAVSNFPAAAINLLHCRGLFRRELDRQQPARRQPVGKRPAINRVMTSSPCRTGTQGQVRVRADARRPAVFPFRRRRRKAGC